MQSRKKTGLSSHSETEEKGSGISCSDENMDIHVELFRILADCEKQKKPGEALLVKAKELSWSILVTIASCFPDVTPFSCLRVWLEITTARLSCILHIFLSTCTLVFVQVSTYFCDEPCNMSVASNQHHISRARYSFMIVTFYP